MNYKVVLVGDGGVGKTAFMNQVHNQSFVPQYQPTLGVKIHSFKLDSKEGEINFDVWDTAGQEKLCGLKDGYYINADAAIVMYDVTSRRSLQNTYQWINDIKRICPNIPIVMVGNKCDIPNAKVFHKTSFKVSSKTGRHVTRPFKSLAKKLANVHF